MDTAEFKKTFKYEITAPVFEIIKDLEEFSTLDKIAEGKKKMWGVIAVIGLVCGVLSLFASAVVIGEMNQYWFAIVPLIAWSAAIGGGITRFVVGRMDIENRRYESVRSALNYLAHDMDKSLPISVSIDFNDYHSKTYQTAAEGGGVFGGVKTLQYTQPWLTLEGNLLDGSRFRLQATTSIKRKEKPKRKYTKVKEAFRDKLTLTMKPKGKSYPDLSALPGLLEAARMPEGTIFSSAQHKGPRVSLTVLSDQVVRMSGRSSYGDDHVRSRVPFTCLLGPFVAMYDALGRAKYGGGSGV